MNYSNEKNELNALCREVNILDRLQRNNKLINVNLSQNNNNVKHQSCALCRKVLLELNQRDSLHMTKAPCRLRQGAFN